MEGYLPEKTCRTCLQKRDELTSLHSKDDDTGPTILEKLRFCASMQILVSEHTPSNACAECVRCITEYYNFKRRCELSEKTLEDLCRELSEYIIAKDVVILKEEVGDDAMVVATKDPDDSNSSYDDDPNWTPCLDDKEEVDEKERSNGDEVGQSESNLKFECETCGKCFKRSYDFNRHLKVHDKPHCCPACGERFKSVEERSTHIQTCRDKDSTEKERSKGDEIGQSESNLKFVCETCGKRFKRSYDFNRHLKVSDKQHCCLACGERFKNAEERSTHIQTCRDKDGTDKTSTPGVPKKDHPCDECSGSFDKLHYLKQHKRLSHSTQLHRCDQCGESFSTGHKLNRHKTKHNQGTKFVCETCGKVYNFLDSLRHHIDENHSVERKVHECKVCGKQYNFIGSYYCHIRLHREQSQYECGICKKRFELKVRLDQHVRRHKKQHRCDMCDKQFKEPSMLAKHKLCHAREAAKPYGCKLCTKRFSTASAVSFHVSTLHNAKKHLKCDVCGMEFYNRFHYAAHYSNHTGIKPYQCDICGKGYNYNQNLTPHRKQCIAQQEKSQNKEVEVTSTLAS